MWSGVAVTLLFEVFVGTIALKYVGFEKVMRIVSQAISSFAPDSMVIQDRLARIKFAHEGRKYELLIPYSETLGGGRVVTSNCVFTSPSGEKLLSDRHPCLPIYVTPDHLGHKFVVRENDFEDDHKVIEQYETIGY